MYQQLLVAVDQADFASPTLNHQPGCFQAQARGTTYDHHRLIIHQNTSAIESLRKMPVVLQLVKHQFAGRGARHAASAFRPYPPRARDRLLDAATALFASHGYQAIGLRDLASHLGLRAGSLYHHIESKQGLLFELIESSLTDLLYETRQCLKGARATSERLPCFVQAFVTYSQANPDKLVLLMREAMNERGPTVAS